MLKACLNGSRLPIEHAALPVSPAQLAEAARDVVVVGVDALHIHPKDGEGRDTLDPMAVAAAVSAVRAAAPGVPLGVTTGAWAISGQRARADAVLGWEVLPSFASVNWHEEGSPELAGLLLRIGVGVEAGLWTTDAVTSWAAWPQREDCTRVLLEVVDDLSPTQAITAAHRLLDSLPEKTSVPVLLHGEGTSAWPVLIEALRLGLHVRIGLEDTLHQPDGRPARNNTDLVRAARELVRATPSP